MTEVLAPKEVNADDPLVEAVAADGLLLGVWGYLRLASRPMTLAEFAGATGIDPATAQRKFDVLGSYGLVESLPASARRRGIAYRARFGGLRIRCRTPADQQVMRRVTAALRSHQRGILARRSTDAGRTETNGWHADFTGAFCLKPQEEAELQRRIAALVDYAGMLRDCYAKRGELPERCNYLLSVRVEPLAEPVLPLAPVRFTRAETASNEIGPDTQSKRPQLSAREREVALALARGMTIREVATELGVARTTAATMTKRVYAKLGVHRRAELVSRLHEAIGPEE